MGNFLRESERNAYSLSRFKTRYVKDKFLHDAAERFLLRHNGNTALLVEKLLANELVKKQAFDPELFE